MRLYIIPLLLLMVSCKESFNPDVDTVNSPLVVEGLITNAANPYEVKLYRALQYNSNKKYTSVTKAKVKVFDDLGYTYDFVEKEPGIYRSDPMEFVGQEGRTYTLTIVTGDNKIFKSNPQKLLPNDLNVATYAEFSSKDVLSTDVYGNSNKETIQGVDLLVDIENTLDSLPHFRFEHKSYREYNSIAGDYAFFGWRFLSDNDLVNFTDEKYQISSKNIEKHAVCFFPTVYTEEVNYLDPATGNTLTFPAGVSLNIAKVTQYRINDESYQFYKGIKSLLTAEGKMFDPIAFQLKGNMQCISNDQIQVLGFFETSSVSISYYAIEPGKKEPRKIKSFEPPSQSGLIVQSIIGSHLPDFWVN